MDAPKRIWAWPHFDGWITGDWSANTYHDDRTVEYILAAEHDRLMAEKDAEIERLREALIWCGGSNDFSEGGVARESWLKVCTPLLGGSGQK